MPLSRHCTSAAWSPLSLWFTTVTEACNTSRSGIRSGWPRPAFEPSVGRVGNSYDNALAETIIGLYKTEVIRRHGPWLHLEAVELATLEWVEWFNHRRLFEPIGDLTPVEKEEIYYQNQEWAKVA